MPLSCIVLAAGSSSRLGRAKQLVLYRGRPLVRHAAELALQSGASSVVVVVPSSAPEIVAALYGLMVGTIENPDAAEGIASSIRCGVRQTPGPWLLMLCDQPLVTPEHLRDLAGTSGLIAATQYPDGHAGVPARFDASMHDELMALRGDAGAQRVIGADSARVQLVDFEEASVDIDTEEDVARLE